MAAAEPRAPGDGGSRGRGYNNYNNYGTVEPKINDGEADRATTVEEKDSGVDGTIGGKGGN